MIRKKEYLEKNVWEKSLERVEYLYQNFDKVVVSFSGGKDSTAVLNATLEVARKLDKLPLEVVFFDEEAIHPPTIDYVKRTYDLDEVDLKWYCLEFKHRNACSNEEPFWYTWDKKEKDKWTREMPEEAITEHKNFKKGMTFQEFAPYLYDRTEGRVAMLTGIRTEESLRRYQVIARKKNDHFINSKAENRQNQYRAFPIYDWNSTDVWLAVHKFEWDYNKTYDIFNQTKMHNKFLIQRVCPPFGEEPLRGLWVYAECFPDMWHKMLNRVKGVATAWRYANSELYSNAKTKPDHITFRQYLKVILESYSAKPRNDVKKTINQYIRYHKSKTSQPLPEDEPHPVSGASWQFLCRVTMRGDFKGRQTSSLTALAQNQRKKLGISEKEANQIYK